MANTHTFTRREEAVNAITHGFGALLSIAALVLLIVFAVLKGNAEHVVSFTIYGSMMLMLYVSSTLVHGFREGKAKRFFEIMDHACIYLFIAGTYTPILLHLVQGTMGWTLFVIVWGLALCGVVFKVFYASKFLFTSTLIYLLMGWMIVIVWGPLKAHLAAGGMHLLIAGGLLYTFGTIFYVWRSFKHHHAVWHLFVLGGSVLHFFVIMLYVLPR
ncbi:PAQR family membrane homeostasis protein TrhA [Paenibacillus glycinis]|uniref:Hemolysin III family protein n=1 Tax=Paenibacillus glycinis TaxID=2697035 RepID=A0ABW9XV47_9BACL|nr:hemolysin III family protein [Paenibacillus glycinis]NBD26201.1 hemolysin III family protein [Paenibacillus glycinis]